MSKNRAVTVDVRDDIRRGREPFGKIMQAVATLGQDQDLILIAPFQPAPLFAVLGNQGFSHTARELESGDWEVTFTRASGKPAGAQGQQAASKPACPESPEWVELDARELEPPQPLVKILEAVAALKTGSCLRARTDRRPMHLYAELEQRGYTGESQEQPDGSFVTFIRPA